MSESIPMTVRERLKTGARTMNEYKCMVPYCRTAGALIFGPVCLCDPHWRAYCYMDDVADSEQFLADIGVRKSEDGTIVSANEPPGPA